MDTCFNPCVSVVCSVLVLRLYIDNNGWSRCGDTSSCCGQCGHSLVDIDQIVDVCTDVYICTHMLTALIVGCAASDDYRA